jgi:hypothetical protein
MKKETAILCSKTRPPAPAPAPPVDGDDVTEGPRAEEDWQEFEEEIELSTEDIGVIRATEAAAARAGALPAAPELDDPPGVVQDCSKRVLGDAFHFMDRPKVPINHESKKGYFVALRKAWFVFDPRVHEEVKSSLRKIGLSEDEIEAKEYYDFDYFRQRVPRAVPPPSIHYPRVRAVYATYGGKVDSKTNKPLFNKAAWKKANNVLHEILKGYAADPPGLSFYSQQLDNKGQPKFDEHGIALLNCNRGTPDVENSHKQLVTTFGTWRAGVYMSDKLHAERRHRYSHRMSIRRRSGFPNFGHFDTWLIDQLQVSPTSSSVCFFPCGTLKRLLFPTGPRRA